MPNEKAGGVLMKYACETAVKLAGNIGSQPTKGVILMK